MVLSKSGKLVTPPGEDLVAIRLVPDIPDELVGGRIEHVVECDSEVGRPEARRQMATVPTDYVDHVVPDFLGELGKLFQRKGANVGGALYRIQQWSFHGKG
jgi:hypothetical protein